MRREFAAFEKTAVAEISELAAVGEAAQSALAEAGAQAAFERTASAREAVALTELESVQQQLFASKCHGSGTYLVVVAPLPHHLVPVVFPFHRFTWRLPEWQFGRRASLLSADS